MRVLISGASGFVGSRILEALLAGGNEVYALTRSPEKNRERFPQVSWLEWANVSEVLDLSHLQGLDAVINLVGENLAGKRWNNEQKKVLYNSRIDGASAIFKMLRNAKLKPKVFVSTSAVGFYGERGHEDLSESSSPGDDFLANLCQSWESVVEQNSDLYERSVILRVGMVFGKGGGAMEKFIPLFKLGLGGKLGNGDFCMSWIHLKDLERIYLRALEDEKMQGVYNAVSPFPVTNKEFTRVMGETLRRPTFFSVPKLALKVAMGEMGEYAVKSAKAVPTRLKDEDFHFLYPTIEVAVKEVVSST